MVLTWEMSAATPGSKVREIRFKQDAERHTWGKPDVVKSEVGDTLVELEKERERLANTTGSTEDGDLGVLQKALHQSPFGIGRRLETGIRVPPTTVRERPIPGEQRPRRCGAERTRMRSGRRTWRR